MDGVTLIRDCKIIRRCDVNVNGCLFSGPMPAGICCSPHATLNWVSGRRWMFLNLFLMRKSQSDSIACLPSVSVFISK